MQFTDTVILDGQPRITSSGYLVSDAKVARTGIQLYSGAEMGRPNMDVVRVMRPEAEVFAEDSMASYVFKPMTNDHPAELVDSTNWKRHSIGFVGDTVARDGSFIRVPLTLMDADAINSFRSGKTALSVGYTATLDWGAGVTEDGEKFDVTQRSIKVNHVALVDRARAGPEARIGDAWTTPSTSKDRDMPDTAALRTVTVDGLSIQTTDQGAQAIDKLQRQLADGASSHVSALALRDAELTSLRDGHARIVAAKDGEIAGLIANQAKAVEAKDGEIAGLTATHKAAIEAKDGEIVALKAKMPDAVAMDAMIARRSAVIDSARKILGDKFDPSGKTEADIRRAAVGKRLGDAAIADKSDEYVGAAFDTLTAVSVADGVVDPVRDAIRNPSAGRAPAAGGTVSAYDSYVDGLENAWRTPAQKDAA